MTARAPGARKTQAGPDPHKAPGEVPPTVTRLGPTPGSFNPRPRVPGKRAARLQAERTARAEEHLAAATSQRAMKRVLVVLVLAFALAGCSLHKDHRTLCSPDKTQLPCTGGVKEGVEYPFNLLTHCGIEWAYFDGHYWVPVQKVDTPSDWEGVEPGTMVLGGDGLAAFEASKGGRVRFVPAPRSYRPPDCE